MNKIVVLIVVVLTGSCHSIMNNRLLVKGGDPFVYQCENGDIITARYYSLSDDSLSFVKIVMPNNKEYTLPNVVSASGARYSDEHTLVWWIKGDIAIVETWNVDGKWQIKYRNCKLIKL